MSVAVFEPPAGVAGLDDIAMMGQAIEHGGGHLGVAEHLGPIGEGEIGGDQQRGVFVELADQVEQQLAARLAEREIAQFVDDDEVIARSRKSPGMRRRCTFAVLIRGRCTTSTSVPQ